MRGRDDGLAKADTKWARNGKAGGHILVATKENKREGSPTKLGEVGAVNVWTLARNPLEALPHHVAGPAQYGDGTVRKEVVGHAVGGIQRG